MFLDTSLLWAVSSDARWQKHDRHKCIHFMMSETLPSICYILFPDYNTLRVTDIKILTIAPLQKFWY